MNHKNQEFELKELYGVDYINKPMIGYEKTYQHKKKKSEILFNEAWQHIVEKFSIDAVVKEITFAFVAFAVLLYMQHTGKTKSLEDFGVIIQAILAFAGFFNLFKASIKSLFPGLLCMSFGFFLTMHSIQLKLFNFITPDITNIIIGIGAFYIAISLLKSSSN